jgi:cytochrome d ubiquinol oxidase subunit II
LPLFLFTFFVVAGLALYVQPGIRTAWQTHPLLLGTVSFTLLIAAFILFNSIGKHPDVRPLAACMVMVACGIAGLAILVFPMVVPFRVSIWNASSSHLSQVFLLTGAIVVTPVVLGYSFFAYWVFRGKTPGKGWDG